MPTTFILHPVSDRNGHDPLFLGSDNFFQYLFGASDRHAGILAGVGEFMYETALGALQNSLFELLPTPITAITAVTMRSTLTIPYNPTSRDMTPFTADGAGGYVAPESALEVRWFGTTVPVALGTASYDTPMTRPSGVGAWSQALIEATYFGWRCDMVMEPNETEVRWSYAELEVVAEAAGNAVGDGFGFLVGQFLLGALGAGLSGREIAGALAAMTRGKIRVSGRAEHEALHAAAVRYA